jgi:glutamine cyclotransferase
MFNRPLNLRVCLIVVSQGLLLSVALAYLYGFAHTQAPQHYQVAARYLHPAHLFTEGLILENGVMYESSGLYRQSKLVKWDLATGKILAERALPPEYFAEGIATIGSYIYQLTYHENTLFVYDKKNLMLIGRYYYPSAGWGLATDGKELIMSNGSATLQFINPQTLKLSHEMQVRVEGRPLTNINSLVYWHDKLYANIYPTDNIAIISPTTGNVEGWLNVQALNPFAHLHNEYYACNGLAVDAAHDLLVLTGKNWLSTYALKLNGYSAA